MKIAHLFGWLVHDRVLNVAIVAVFGIAILMAALRIRGRSSNGPSFEPAFLTHLDDWEVFRSGGIRLGSPDATVSVVEFVDLRCSVCGRAAGWIAKYRDDPAVEVVIRHFPSDSLSYEGAIALECGHAQGRVWELMELVYDRQAELESLRWAALAGEVGVPDTVSFNRCMRNVLVRARPRTDSLAAVALGVPGTPTFVVNDLLVGGFSGPEYMDRIVEEAKISARTK